MNTRTNLTAERKGFPSLLFVVGLALLSFNSFAQAPNPPVFTSLDGQEIDPNPGGRYSVSNATRGLPFAVATPTPPQISAEQIVTPSTIGNYINTPGMRLLLEPGNYGRLSLRGTDQEIVLTSGVIVNQLYTSGQRIVVRAVPVRTGTIDSLELDDGTADLLLDGIRVDGSSYQGRNHIWNCRRVAVINSRIRQVDFSFAAYGNADDVIIANNYMETYGSAQTAVRLHSMVRLVFVDNNVRATGGNGMFRLHANSRGRGGEYLYVGRNQFEGGAWMIKPSSNEASTENTIGAVWIEGNASYWPGEFWYINTRSAPDGFYASPFTYRNNVAYTPNGIHPAPGDHPWNATIENNSVRGYVAPPAWDHQ